ncbi:MAG: cofactor-independent phosphoglycerate mutase [Bacteroidaceae bacterium]|nr:cofactor-independent phosphoglycerate mutase [Bacteroidaceae bacterium]
MKYIIILGDGMADWADAFDGQTVLQHARKPYMNMLAKEGRTGMVCTVPEGFTPGSEVANMGVLGYDVHKVFEGRGVLEAANIGVDLKDGDMGMRCNLICVENGCIKNHSAGHLTTEEGRELIQYLDRELGSDKVRFHPGIQYRHLLVVNGGQKELLCTPPHDVPGQPFEPLMIKAATPQAQSTADLLNGLIMRSQELLAKHPINLARKAQGKDMANSIWPWSPGYRPQMATLAQSFPQLKKSAVISAVDLIKGIGKYAGMEVIDVEGATGLFDTNYENKTRAALDALKTNDLVYVHVEAADEAGHEGNSALKLRCVEDLDSRLIGPIYEEVKNWDEPVCIAVLPDHPTPCSHRTHTRENVPFLIWHRGIEPDKVQTYDEESCQSGIFGTLEEGTEFIRTLLNS